MKAKDATKKKTKTPIEVKDIAPKADPTGGHRHSKKQSGENNLLSGETIRRAS